MESAIVTIQREGEAWVQDIEVPLDMSASELAQQLALALGWPGDLEIYAVPPQRVLAPHETLAQAGVWDGARLIFRPSSRGGRGAGQTAPTSSPTTTAPPAGPVSGWRPLDGPASPATPPEPRRVRLETDRRGLSLEEKGGARP